MRGRQRSAAMVSALALTLAFALATCSSSGPTGPGENVGEAQSAVFTNGGFETGAAGMPPPSWTVQSYLNNGITVQTPQTRAGLNLLTTLAGHNPPKGLTTILASAAGPLSQPDPDLTATASLRWPRYGNQCAIVNSHSSTNFVTGGTNNGQNVNSLSQTMTIGPGDVDPMDGKVHVRFVVAPVLQNPTTGHTPSQVPYYLVQLTDLTTQTLLYSDFNLSSNPGVPWQTANAPTGEIHYTDWQLVDISPTGNSLAMGDMVELEVIAAGCSLGGHFGEIYVDGSGNATLPGLFVSGTAPAQANACTNITYTLNYENGAATGATGVTVTFNTPPGTTYQSINAPGLACSTPAAGAAGAVVCTIGNLAAGAAGSFQITVNITCAPCTMNSQCTGASPTPTCDMATGTCVTTGTTTAGNYSIQGTGIESLLGSHINTTIGCTADSQCPAGQWCDESEGNCTPTLANSTPVPTDGPHTTPVLNGKCTAAAGALVCSSGVCDASNNECGYANGDGSCTPATGDVFCQSSVCDTDGLCGYANDDGPCAPGTNVAVCRSTVCDTDGLCGYADGDGPCTPGASGNGSTVCRSGMCSTDMECEPAKGCNVDADCPGAWCKETTHTCSPQLANGSPVPVDSPRTGTTLDGTCTAAAGALVCVSGVCDTSDNKCGYANGDGPCGGVDGGAPGDLVCRSTICATTGTNAGTCVACTMDSQCPSAEKCITATNTCAQCATSADCPATTPVCDTPSSTCVVCNGNNGTAATEPCSTTSAPFCFLSGGMKGECGVCTKDSDCAGQPDGETTCDTTTGVCINGCVTDADCATGTWCNASPGSTGTCVPKLANGTPLPSTPADVSTCTPSVGMRVCLADVCDPKDNACGYANGDGPCDNGEECRGGTCDTTAMICGCSTDSQCPSGDYCGSGTCIPKQPLGSACTADDQCQSNTCADRVCSEIVGTGNGVVCTAGPVGSSTGGGAAGLVGLLLAVAGGSRWGRKRPQAPASCGGLERRRSARSPGAPRR